ncbi:hypothetical protein [Desulfopila sp. IMCC35008]|uniref:hypothetical protein n=1 Tax=Desulfopila sp. IMCC35008 TaxID=2653858 RepID=UPI0013D57611|nr:hypothetical protein [Desulfopila sp. IMCC35008]
MVKNILQRSEDSRRTRALHRLTVALLFAVSLLSLFIIHENVSAVFCALAGALLYKVGTDRSAGLTRLLGLALQLAGSYVFLDIVFYPFQAASFANYYFYGCLLIGCSAVYTGFCIDRLQSSPKKWEGALSSFIIFWGMCWLYYGGIREISTHSLGVGKYNMLLLYFCAVTIVMTIVSEKLHWLRLSLAQIILLPAAFVCGLWGLVEVSGFYHLFGSRGWIAWMVTFFCLYRLLHHYDGIWPARLVGFWHIGCLWLVVIVFAHEVGWFCFTSLDLPFFLCLSVRFGLTMLAGLFVLLLRNMKVWPVTGYRKYYIWGGILLPAVGIVVHELVLILGG